MTEEIKDKKEKLMLMYWAFLPSKIDRIMVFSTGMTMGDIMNFLMIFFQ